MITLFAALSAGAKTYLRCNFSIFFFNDLTERLGGCLYKCGCFGKRFRSIKESITQLSQNSNEMNNDSLNTRTRGTLIQRSTLQPRISVDIKRNRKRSDSVLWQKPLHQQKCQKGKVTTQTTPQKSSIRELSIYVLLKSALIELKSFLIV